MATPTAVSPTTRVLRSLEFGAGQTPENLVVDDDGTVLMSFAYAGTVVRLDPDRPERGLTVVARLPVEDGTAAAPGGTTSGQVTGLVRAADGRLLVATVTGRADSHGIWQIPDGGSTPTLLAALPTDGFPNGLLDEPATLNGDRAGAVLVADSRLATIWRVDLVDGAITPAVSHPALAAGSPTGLGANGLAWLPHRRRTEGTTQQEALLVSVTDAATVYRIPWKDGVAIGPPVPWVTGTAGVDDLTVDPVTGQVWAVGNTTNLCWHISPSAQVQQILTADDGLHTPTACALRRSPRHLGAPSPPGGPGTELIITCAGYLPPHTPNVLAVDLHPVDPRADPHPGAIMTSTSSTSPPSGSETSSRSAPSDPDAPLPADLAAYRDSYTDLFGTLPPLPAGKFAFTGQVAPDFLRRVEELRARAFDNPTFDTATTQLLIFGMMIASGGGAAVWHATAARRAGASLVQLQTVVELATAVAALEPANQGGALLDELRGTNGRHSTDRQDSAAAPGPTSSRGAS